MSVDPNEAMEPCEERPSEHRAPPRVPRHKIPADFDEQAVEIMRQRLVAARRLNRLDQKDAARKLGYSNSAPLSKIESGAAKVPKNFLLKAALCYGVSMDWLVGLSSEPDRDPRTAQRQRIEAGACDDVRRYARALAESALARVHEDFDARRLLERITARADRVVASYRDAETTPAGRAAHAAAIDMLAMHISLLRDLLAEARKELSRRRDRRVDVPDPQTTMDIDE